MRYLLDSHVFLWLLYDPDRLSVSLVKKLEQAQELLVSTASIWELSIKHQKGALAYKPEKFISNITNLGATDLPVLLSHVQMLEKVNLPQKDPFDKMLIAQALSEGLTLVTADRQLLDTDYPTLSAL